jgi:dipeptidyl aminopeptidase/acylaminoacyl peptidase
MVQKVLAAGIAIALSAVAILAVPAVRHLREKPPQPPPSIRLTFSVSTGLELGSGDEILDVAISPDEQHIVFVATSDGTARLWRRGLPDETAVLLRGTLDAQLPAWKQTGNVVSFFAGGRLKLYSFREQTVADLAPASAPSGATWLLDGSLLFAPDARGAIRRLLNGTVSEATRLRPGDRSHAFPVSVDASNAFVYTAILTDGRRMVRLVEHDREIDLVATSGHGQLVGNTVLHVRDGVLLSQQLDPETRQRSGNANPVGLDVGTASSGHSFFAASQRLLISAPPVKRLRQLTWFPLGGQKSTPTRDPGDYWQVRLSPDDRFAAITQSTPLLRTLDVVVIPMSETGYVEPVTRAVAADSDPVWSPDALTLVFRSLQDGRPHLYTHAAHDQDAADQIVPMSQADETPTDWRGDHAVAHAPGSKGDLDLVTVTMRNGARETVVSSPFNESDARLSPDGRWVAYVSDESGQPDIYASPWPRGARVRVSFAGGTRPRWSRDGRSLFFLRGARIMQADVAAGGFAAARAVLSLPGVRDFDVAHRQDAVLALMPAEGSTGGTASVVVDWPRDD